MAEPITQKDMIKDMYDKFSDLNISELNTFLTLQTEKNKKYDDLCKEVYGNGEPGLCEDVRVLRNDMRVIKWVVGVAGAAFISTLIGLWINGVFDTITGLFS